ncbi:hypothetical protein LguiA_024243 [Lonicera macranthoides]
MFMSIFSSFDAVCAESFGHKVGFSFPLLPPFNITQKETGSSNNNNNNNNVTSSPDIIKNEKDKNQQRERKARFAPELDGLHCFETIVPSY